MNRRSVVFISLLIINCYAGFTKLDNTVSTESVIMMRFGAYSLEESPFGGTHTASLTYDLRWTYFGNRTLLPALRGEVLVFLSDVRKDIGVGGFSLFEDRKYCCTNDLFRDGKCKNLHSLIFSISEDPAKNGGVLYYRKINSTEYGNNSQIAEISDSQDLWKTGMWYIFLANCDGASKPLSLILNGTIELKNPFGYLPGQILGYLPLYWIMATGYVVIGIAWFIASCIYHKDMMNLQHAITFVIAISIAENLLWASDYTVYDFLGIISDWANIFGALFTATKLTAVRTLLLLVAIGYTITRPVLTTGYKLGIAFLTIFYFIVEAANRFIAVGATAGHDVNQIFQYVDLILLILANAAFFAWIGFEMYSTVKQLKSTGEKFGMYKRLSILLILSITLSILIVITQLAIESSDQADKYFRVWWLFDSYWEFIYFACILYVAWVWRPTEQNQRYAYQELLELDEKSTELEKVPSEIEENSKEKDNDKESQSVSSSDDSSSESSKDQ